MRDDRQDILDEARIYCRDAVRHLSYDDWKAAVPVLLARIKQLDMALQSLTPGGSEYIGEPDRCVAAVRDKIDNYRALVREALAKTE